MQAVYTYERSFRIDIIACSSGTSKKRDIVREGHFWPGWLFCRDFWIMPANGLEIHKGVGTCGSGRTLDPVDPRIDAVLRIAVRDC